MSELNYPWWSKGHIHTQRWVGIKPDALNGVPISFEDGFIQYKITPESRQVLSQLTEKLSLKLTEAVNEWIKENHLEDKVYWVNGPNDSDEDRSYLGS